MGREEKWINIAKVVAILAVLTDHTYMVLYDNDLILLGSFFSVSLFMLLSGYTFVIAAEKKRNFTLWQLTKKNLTKIMIPYVGATFIYFTINEQISNFAQTYPTNLKASSNEALLFMRRYRFANCSCFSCCFKDAYPSSNVQ